MRRKQLWCKRPVQPDFFIMNVKRLNPWYNKRLAKQATELAKTLQLPFEFYVK